MTDRFVSYKTGPAFGPGEPGAVIRRGRTGIEMVNLIWGFPPMRPGARPITTIQAEGRRFPRGRCLIPASEFFLSRGSGAARSKWRFTLIDDDFFYLAGIWRSAQDDDWPPAYAILTARANADVAPYRDRQMAVIRRRDRMAWLDLTRPEDELLRPLPARSFRVEQVAGPRGAQGAFAFS